MSMKSKNTRGEEFELVTVETLLLLCVDYRHRHRAQLQLL
jgi:hypothetical protein